MIVFYFFQDVILSINLFILQIKEIHTTLQGLDNILSITSSCTYPAPIYLPLCYLYNVYPIGLYPYFFLFIFVMGHMKTIMIIDGQHRFTNQIKHSLEGEDVTVLSAETNRDALRYVTSDCSVDLFLVPTESINHKKGFLACKSTDSFTQLNHEDVHLLSEESSSEEVKTVVKKNLSL